MKQNIDLLIETEKKLLSALMLKGGQAIPEVSVDLKPDDFYRPEHRVIYKALLELSNDNVPLDILLVEQALAKSGDLAKVTHTYLFGIYSMEHTTLRAMTYAKEIKAASTYRKLADTGRFLTNAAENEMPLEDLVAQVEARITKDVDTSFKQGVSATSQLLVDLFDSLNSQKGAQGLQTGFFKLDTYTGGLKKSDMIILAARPSMGKSALAMNIAVNVAKTHSVLFFSLEMSKAQLTERIFAADARVNATKIQHRNLDGDDIDALLSTIVRFETRNLFIDDTAGISLAEIKMKARKIQREHGLDLIVIDYLQLMRSSDRYQGNRTQEVSELSQGIKALARDLDIPIIALSQLSRGVELRADKRPILSDLRESGSIEQDADIVMFLYRDEYYDRDNADNKGLAELRIAKNRNGVTGSAKLKFEAEYSLFSDLTWSDD